MDESGERDVFVRSPKAARGDPQSKKSKAAMNCRTDMIILKKYDRDKNPEVANHVRIRCVQQNLRAEPEKLMNCFGCSCSWDNSP